MSRGQKPRTPAHFPRMRDRGAKRRWVMAFGTEGQPGQEIYMMFRMRRRNIPKGWFQVPNLFADGWVRLSELTSAAWELSADDPLDASAWVSSVERGGES